MQIRFTTCGLARLRDEVARLAGSGRSAAGSAVNPRGQGTAPAAAMGATDQPVGGGPGALAGLAISGAGAARETAGTLPEQIIRRMDPAVGKKLEVATAGSDRRREKAAPQRRPPHPPATGAMYAIFQGLPVARTRPVEPSPAAAARDLTRPGPITPKRHGAVPLKGGRALPCSSGARVQAQAKAMVLAVDSRQGSRQGWRGGYQARLSCPVMLV